MDHSVVFSRNVTKIFSITFEKWASSTVLLSSTWLHIWLQHHSSFPLLLPLPLSLDVLICNSTPPTCWVNQHSNYSMEFTSNLSPPTNGLKNLSFPAMHFTLELLRSPRYLWTHSFAISPNLLWHYCRHEFLCMALPHPPSPGVLQKFTGCLTNSDTQPSSCLSLSLEGWTLFTVLLSTSQTPAIKGQLC